MKIETFLEQFLEQFSHKVGQKEDCLFLPIHFRTIKDLFHTGQVLKSLVRKDQEINLSSMIVGAWKARSLPNCLQTVIWLDRIIKGGQLPSQMYYVTLACWYNSSLDRYISLCTKYLFSRLIIDSGATETISGKSSVLFSTLKSKSFGSFFLFIYFL